MAKSQEWKVNSTNIENGRIKISGAAKYVKDGVNKFSTFTSDNKNFGRVPLDPDSSNRIVKNTFYSIDSDGFVDFYIEDAQGKFRKYQSIQEIADAGIVGYNATTTDLLKGNLQGRLDEKADEVQIPGPANPDASIDNDGNTSNGEEPNKGGDSTPINLTIQGPENKPVGGFKYPLHLGTQVAANLDRIKFTQGEYVGVTLNRSIDLSQRAFSDRQFKFNYDSVTLGIQPTISDKNTVQWNGGKLNEIQAQAAKASIDVMNKGDFNAAVQSLTEIGGEIFSQVKDNPEIAKALNIYFGAKAAGIDPGQLSSRVTGSVLNPNLELLFEGPTLRQFNYTFTMSARSKDETKEIKGIIKYFKQGMAIKKSTSGMFLKSPNVFKIQYIKGSETKHHDGLNRVKTCALLDCSVDYTPAGNYTTYKDGSMTMYKMTLSFGELNPIYAEDYDEKVGPIGY